MVLLPWEQVREEALTRYKIFDVRRAIRRSPRTGAEIGMFVIGTAEWVQIVAITDDERMIFVRQFRQGTRAFSLEIPAGIVSSPDEDVSRTAARELREETGYEAEDLVALGSASPNPAIFENRIHTFLATGCHRVGDLQLDPGEDLEYLLVPVADVEDMIRRGEIDSALVIAGLFRWRLGLRG